MGSEMPSLAQAPDLGYQDTFGAKVSDFQALLDNN